MLLGLRTVVYGVDDLERARGWYAGLLGVAPYFDEPFYVGFDVGGYELGLVPANEGDRPAAGQSYWGVDSIGEAWAALLEAGAEPVDEPSDVGGGIVLGVVLDPEGNRLGIIENPHFAATG